MYPISYSFCQIFLWFITLSGPQLDITFKHGCFLLQTYLTFTVMNWRCILNICRYSSQRYWKCVIPTGLHRPRRSLDVISCESSNIPGLKFLYMHAYIYIWTCMPQHACGVRRQLDWISNLFPWCGFWKLILGSQAWKQVYLSMELSHYLWWGS